MMILLLSETDGSPSVSALRFFARARPGPRSDGRGMGSAPRAARRAGRGPPRLIPKLAHPDDAPRRRHLALPVAERCSQVADNLGVLGGQVARFARIGFQIEQEADAPLGQILPAPLAHGCLRLWRRGMLDP